ncbi:hypothetical protein [Jiella sp. M17.18]|uniref:hypothetical protein n=1 Tax=Jiella sp. M17.18 TaxID=3234247 RepID=UPI0034DE61E3
MTAHDGRDGHLFRRTHPLILCLAAMAAAIGPTPVEAAGRVSPTAATAATDAPAPVPEPGADDAAVATTDAPGRILVSVPAKPPTRLAFRLKPLTVVPGESFIVDVSIGEPDAAPSGLHRAGTVAFVDPPETGRARSFLINVPKDAHFRGSRAEVTIALVGLDTPLHGSRVEIADPRLIP